jgi:Family of unknown function (DUF5677)
MKPMDYVELPAGELLDPYQPDWLVLEGATAEAPFLEAGFYLLRELSQLVAVIASLQPEPPLDRNRAILRGLLVRLTKLLRLTLRELMAKECFQQLNVQRSILETLGTLKYLIDDDGNGTRFDQYVMNSLIVERELLEDITDNIDKRDGAVLHIEERMRRSIKGTAQAAGITDVSALPGRKKIGWLSAERRVQLLGPNAYVAYRTGSTEVHGDWTDLFRNHLEYDGTAFRPRLNDLHIRPHTSLTPTVLIADFIAAYADTLIESDARQYLVVRLQDVSQRAVRVTELHEALLARVGQHTESPEENQAEP